ncbi:glycosyltransferase family 2 protein [Spirulina sp. CS-785/01]|uniref:glycosyltransferase family 2 protein n=1 Tax=Spirulina sp. CS-785/01 TaxID=3021716 RepID=UPI00232D73BD|nr:glycosyltransferase family 2 protein [Spirulina sp. CS-785/01]MDB9315470.1 glycosyltransferase family 2 protein [Spirulina sp. CS-785/01]
MKFSIVITTYNRLTLLKRAVYSACRQTVPCDVIVVDDCSTDGTQEYMTALCSQNPHVLYHRNKINLGHSQSVNRGVELATGDWIKPLDDDDYLAAECVEMMQNAIQLRPQAVICSAQALQVDEQEKPLYLTCTMGQGLVCYIPQGDIHRGMLLEEVPFGTPAQVAFQRDAFLKSGGWDSSLDANFDDIDSWLKIAQFGDALFINRCLAYRTVWSGSYNQKLTLLTRLKTHILIKHKIYQFVDPQDQDQIPQLRHIENYLRLHWSLIALKQRQWRKAFSLAASAPLDLQAWQLLFRRFQREQTVNSFLPPAVFPQLVHNLREQTTATGSLIQNYTTLRWGLKAWQNHRPIQAFQLASLALCSPTAWPLFFTLFSPPMGCPPGILLHPNHITLLKIICFLQKKAPSSLTDVQEFHLCLKFRLVRLAFHQRRWFILWQYLWPLLGSRSAWRLLIKLWFRHNRRQRETEIRKIILMDALKTGL